MGPGEMWAMLPEGIQTAVTLVGFVSGVFGLFSILTRLGPDKVNDAQAEDLRKHYGHGI